MLFLFLLFVLRIVESQKTSPCPSTFSYREKSETSSIPRDVWAGEITLRTVEDLAGVFINVILDKPSESLGSFFGEVTTSDNREYVITNTKYNLEAGPAVIVEIFVKYDTNEEVPGVKIIRLNGKTICSTKVHEVYLRPTLPTLHISQSKNSSSRPGDVNEEPPRYEDENRPQPSHRPGEGLSSQRPSGGPRPIEGVYSYGTQPSAFIISHAPSHRPSSHSDDREHTTERHTTSRITTERYNNDNEYNSNRRTTGVHSSYDQGYSTESHTSSRRTTERNNGDNEYSNKRTTERYNSNESNGYQSSRDERTTERNNPRTTRRTTTKTPNHSIGNALETPDDSDSDFFIGDFGNYRPTQNRPRPTQQSASSYTCGTVAARPSPLISSGQGTIPGQWPWHAALYHSKGLQLVYTCGGTLISQQHIVTAAHCVAKPRSTKPVDTNNLIIYLGKYDLISFGTDVQARDVSDISSTVVGWGFDQNKKLSNKLMQAQMPVVSSVTCIYSNREFFSQFTFENNFCAGFRNGTSVCNGDSGGGMVFPIRETSSQNTVWQLRGIVSVGVALQGSGTCDTSHYVVFTDVAKYTHWIRQMLV